MSSIIKNDIYDESVGMLRNLMDWMTLTFFFMCCKHIDHGSNVANLVAVKPLVIYTATKTKTGESQKRCLRR